MESGNSDEVNKDALNEAIAKAEGLNDEQKEAVEEALAEAKAVAEDKEATQEEVDAAAEALNEAIAEATKEPEVPAEDKIAVAKVEAVNTGEAVTVTFPEELTEEEIAKLEGATIELKDAEGNTFTATYTPDSYDSNDHTAQFKLDGDKVLVDNTKYTVTSDVLADQSFTAKVGKAYVTKLDTKTIAVSSVSNEIVIDAFNQYGDKAPAPTTDVKVSASLNGMPLKAKEAKYADGKVEIAEAVLKAATEGSKLSLVVTYDRKEEGKVVDTVKLEKTLAVLTGEEAGLEAKPVDIEKVVAKVGEEELDLDKELAPDTEVELTPIVLDQYGNEFETQEETVRWAITEGADLISFLVKEGEEVKESTDKVLTAQTVKYVAKAPGKVVITAFNQSNGKTATHEITIGEVDINKLTYALTTEETEAAASAINFEEAALGTITFNKGADLQPEDVKYKVTETKDGKEVDASAKVEIKTAWKEVDEGQEPTEMTVTATAKEEGTYTITPYAVNEKGKEVVAETSATLTSTKHADVKTVELLDVEKENVLKVTEPKTPVTKELVFKNKYDEPIEPDFAKDEDGNVIEGKIEGLTINSSNDGLLEVSGVTKTDATDETDAKYTIKLTPIKAGEVVLTLQGIGKPVVYNFTLEGSVLTEAKVEKENLEPMIAGDKVKGEDGTVTKETKAQYNKLTLHDKDGDQMPDLATNDKYKFEVYDSKGNKVEEDQAFGLVVVDATEDEEGNIVELEKDATEAKTAKYVKVAPTKEAKAGKYTVKVIAQAENKDEKLKEVAAEFKLEVKEARKAKELKVDPTSTNIALDGQAKVLVTLTDQYGDPFALENAKTINVGVKDLAEDATSPFDKELLKAASVAGEVGQYEFTVKPVVDSGQYTLVVSYEVEAANDDKKAVVIEEEVTVTVGVGAELVKSLEIENEKNEIVDGKATYLYKANGTDEKKPFTLVAKDENGEIVNIDTAGEGITWHSSNPDVATVGKDGKVTTKALPENTEETVEVWADYYGAVTTEKVTIVVSNKEEKIQPNTLQATVPVEVDGKDEPQDQIVTEVVIDENAPNGTITLTYTGTDQYGDSKDAIDFSTLQIPNTAVATAEQLTDDADEKTNKVKITAVKEGEANIRTVIDGAELNLPIIVKKEAVVIAQDAKTLADAATTANKLTVEELTFEGDTDEVSASKVKTKVEEAIEADENGIDVAVVNKGNSDDVARNAQEDAADQDAEEGTTATYEVTLTKGDAEPVKFDLTATFKLSEDAKAVAKAKATVEAGDAFKNLTVEAEKTLKDAVEAKATELVENLQGVTVEVAEITDPTEGQANFKVTLTKGKVTETVDVIASEKKSDEKAVTATTIGTLDADGKKVTGVPASTKVSALKAALTVSDDAAVEILDGTGGTAVTDQESADVTATMVIQVTAQDGTTQEYTIELEEVVVDSDEKAVTATTIGTVDEAGKKVTGVPASTKVSALKAALTVSDDAAVEILDGTGGTAVTDQESADVTATMVIQVTAQDGTTQEYTIELEEVDGE